ncbi:MAG: hypothetical protein M1839_005523 [Geoglossum umbratile]|nr:MAG: hypothetical protein M1839_005523 [Geoglossum umbratile]
MLMESVYSSPSGTFVSGVGCRDGYGDATWIAPSDPTMRWDDDYLFPASDELPVMQQHPLNGRHGFVLHDACWHLLQRAFRPSEIPLERLLEVCESLPFPLRGDGVCWGHDYGGLLILDDQDHYPWGDRLVAHRHSPGVRLIAEENPYNVLEIPALLVMRLEHLPEWLPKTQRHDCFSRLPWEILETVAIELPTSDALGLRRVSRAFLPLLSSGTFWASRFEANGDRNFIFEKWKSRDTTDWMSLYQLTSHAHNSPGLRNRKRIWDLIGPITYLTSLRLAEGSKTTRVDQNFASLGWSRVAGDIRGEASDGYPKDFHEGCRLFGMYAAYVPKDLLRICFSISGVGNINYVVGIRLVTEKGPDIRLGFESEGKEAIREVTALRGFILAAGSRGIHALKVVSENGSPSEWVGCPNNSPVTERLAHFNSIAALEVGFDGYKVVSLGVSGKVSPSVQTPKGQGLSLREAALWYPIVPEPELCLNEASFTGENPSSAGYQPLFWVHFGGPGGSYLKRVTGVSVNCPRGLYSLEFYYDATRGPAGAYKLGRRKATDTSKVLEFPIDGAGGEFIETLEVTLRRYEAENAYSFLKHGKLNSLRITTNRKRSLHVGAPPDGAPLKPVAIAPGTTLTGLYASQVGTDLAVLKMSVVDKRLKHPEYGLISLGAISEAVNNTRERVESESVLGYVVSSTLTHRVMVSVTVYVPTMAVFRFLIRNSFLFMRWQVQVQFFSHIWDGG